MVRKAVLIFICLIILTGCINIGSNKDTYNGRLEAETIRLSSQTNGIVNMLSVQEGDQVEPGQIIAVVNKEKLALQKQQIESDLRFNRDLLNKTEKMLATGAATKQRRDELATKVAILRAQKETLDLQLSDAAIKSPIQGIVLNKYVNKGELVVPGSLVAEVADLRELEAIIYLPLNKLTTIKIGQQVLVQIEGLAKPVQGKISWIASESEFTPKTILTKETRTTLVYAVKIIVPNKTGELKIGMPIDVQISGSK